MAARRKPEGKSTPPEARATQRPHTRPRPCKRCAASARRRSCRSSSRLAREDTRDELLEARIAAQIVEAVINQDPAQIGRVEGGVILIALLERANGCVLVAECQLNQSQRISGNILSF